MCVLCVWCVCVCGVCVCGVGVCVCVLCVCGCVCVWCVCVCVGILFLLYCLDTEKLFVCEEAGISEHTINICEACPLVEQAVCGCLATYRLCRDKKRKKH